MQLLFKRVNIICLLIQVIINISLSKEIMQYTYQYPVPFQQYSQMPLLFPPPTAFRRHQQYLQIGLLSGHQVQELMKKQDLETIQKLLKIISKRVLNEHWFSQQSNNNKMKLINLLQYINKYIRHSKNERVQYLQQLRQANQEKQKQLKNRKKFIEKRKDVLYSLKQQYNVKKQAVKEYRATLQRLPKCKICKKTYRNLKRHNEHYHFVEQKTKSNNDDSNIMVMKQMFLKNQQMLERIIQKQQQQNIQNLNKNDQKIYQSKLIQMKEEIDRLKGKISELELLKSKKQSNSSGVTDQPKMVRKITKKYDMDNSDRSKSNNSDYLSKPPMIHQRNDELNLSPIKDEIQENIYSTLKIKESSGEIKQSAQIYSMSGRPIKKEISNNSNKHLNELYNSSAKIADSLMQSEAPVINILTSQKVDSGIRPKFDNQNKFQFDEIEFQSRISKQKNNNQKFLEEIQFQSKISKGKNKNTNNRKNSEQNFEMMDQIGQNSIYRNQKRNNNSKISKIPKDDDDKKSKKELISKILETEDEQQQKMQINEFRSESNSQNIKNKSKNPSKNQSRKSQDQIRSQQKYNLGVQNLGQVSKIVARTPKNNPKRKFSQQQKPMKIPLPNIDQGPIITIIASNTNVSQVSSVVEQQYPDDFEDEKKQFRELQQESKVTGHHKKLNQTQPKQPSKIKKTQESQQDEIISMITGANPSSSMKHIANIDEKYPPNKTFQSDDDDGDKKKFKSFEADIITSKKIQKIVQKQLKIPVVQDSIIKSKEMNKPPQNKLSKSKQIRKVVSPKVTKQKNFEIGQQQQQQQGFPQIDELASKIPQKNLKKSSKKDTFPDIDSLQSKVNQKNSLKKQQSNSFRQIQSVQTQNSQEQIEQSILDDKSEIENKRKYNLQQQYEKIKKIKNEKVVFGQKQKEERKKQLKQLQKLLAEQYKTIFKKDLSTSKNQDLKTIQADIQKLSTNIIKNQQVQIADLKKKNAENQKKKKFSLQNSLQISKSYAMNQSFEFQLQKDKDKIKKQIEIVKQQPKKEADTSHLNKYNKSRINNNNNNNNNSFNSKSQNRKQQMNFKDKDEPLQMIQSNEFFKKQVQQDSF